MIHLIGDHEDDCNFGIEHMLARRGLAEISDLLSITEDLYVYGCGPFIPGQDYDELVKHSQAGDLLGVIALWFTELSVAALPAELRAHLGAVLQLAPSIYVPDKLGAYGEGNGGWCLHYGVQAKLGGHPAWCAPGLADRLVSGGSIAERPAATVGEIIESALGARYFAVQAPTHPMGSMNNVVYSEVRRFVEQAGLADHMQHPAVVSPEILVREHKRAVDTVEAMVDHWRWRGSRAVTVAVPGDPVSSVWARVAGACAVSTDPADMRDVLHRDGPSAFGNAAEILAHPKGDPVVLDQVVELLRQAHPAGRRELVLGTRFDPITHYDDAYYAEGAGLLYTRPDGTKDVYHGPAREWEGMKSAADFLWRVFRQPKPVRAHPKLIDIGCDGGCFVEHARRVGFDACGYDISEHAVAYAKKRGRDYISLQNVVTDPPKVKANIVTALDFWEHVYVDDIDELAKAVYDCLEPNGVGFFIICTRSAAEQDWTIPKDYVFDKAASWLTVSGHVTIRTWQWWVERFAAAGFYSEYHMAYEFMVLRDSEPGLATALSWGPKNLVVVRK